MKSQRPTAGLREIARQNTCSEGMLRARAGIDGDPGGQKLGVTADKELRHARQADDYIADAENHGPFEKTGDKAIDHLETLADKVRDSGQHPELEQAKAEIGHHHGEHHGRNTVLKMVERMATADKPQGETPLRCGFFQWLGGECRRCCCVLIVHDVVTQSDSSPFCTGSRNYLSMALTMQPEGGDQKSEVRGQFCAPPILIRVRSAPSSSSKMAQYSLLIAQHSSSCRREHRAP